METAGQQGVDSPWSEGQFRLGYYLGEFRLFSVSFRAQLLNLHFTELARRYPDLHTLEGELHPGFNAALIRSCPLPEHLPRIATTQGVIRYVPEHFRRFYIDLQGRSFEDYLKGFSSKSRSTLMRKVRKFREASEGEVQWRLFRREEEMEEFFRLARHVSSKTYQERLLGSGLPEDEGFRAHARELAAADSVRAFILYHRGQPLAYLYCPAQDGILYYEYLGYDPQFQAWSPGTVLQYLALESLFGEARWRMFDFTEGEGPHKEFFSTSGVLCANVYYFRRRWRYRILIYVHSALNDVSRLAVRALDKTGLKSTIKKWFRRSA
jgi:CelD/BcsL family acetyltransferase involved in cellulose biosynthesis